MKLSLYHAPFGGLLFVALGAIPAHAQWATFDATQNVNAIKQILNEQKSLVYQTQRIAQGSETNMTLAQQLSTDLKLAATAMQTYNTVYSTYNTILNNLRYFNSKQIWRTAESALMSGQVANQFGETSGLQATINGQTPQNASLVWRIMNLGLQGTSSQFWGNQVVGASDRLAALAGMEAIDAASTTCLGAVGSYNQARNNNTLAAANLQQSQFDITSFTNSELQQLNLLNASHAQTTAEQRAQGQLHACLAAQAAASNMPQRNATSATINDANFKLSQQSVNPTYAARESSTWTTYY